ncbi:MAG: nitrilase family protein [Bacteroidales bacterium]|nr:nitrilase family protein [Candidatus Liminaster caballi]
MKISLFQQDIHWLDPTANWHKVEQVLIDHPDTDLLVLPEMCTTGFDTAPVIEQIETEQATEHHLCQLARQYGTAIVGSFAIRETSGNGMFNRCYFATPEDGCIAHYDKKHLFSPGGEDRQFESGNSQVVAEWRGIRFMLSVCYDLRFPVWLRNTEQLRYDILVCVANWPDSRQLAWDTLIRARAIENQAYCIAVNRVGDDKTCHYVGGTSAIHPYGHAVANCNDNEEGICSFSPDMDKLISYRTKFPSLQDADAFALGVMNKE